MDLSVVIPVLNVGDVFTHQLDALVRQRYEGPWEIVIADNGSTDHRTVRIARAYAHIHPRVRIIDASHRRGRSAAVNAGIAAARSERIAVCDADDVVAQDWVPNMIAALREHRFVSGPLDVGRLNPPWAATARGHHRDQTAPPYIAGGPPWPFATGANIGVHKKWHCEVGGYDESFTYGGEDCDYAWKLHVKGVRLQWTLGVVVHYRLRTSLRDIYRQARAYSVPFVTVQQRWGDVWPDPPIVPTRREHVMEALRLTRVMRSRAGVGFWVWRLGWNAGLRRGAAMPPVGPLPPEHFDDDAVVTVAAAEGCR